MIVMTGETLSTGGITGMIFSSAGITGSSTRVSTGDVSDSVCNIGVPLPPPL